MIQVLLLQLNSGGQWKELAAAGIYKLVVGENGYKIDCFPWKHNTITPNEELRSSIVHDSLLELPNFHSLNLTIPSTDDLILLPDSVDIDKVLTFTATNLQQECEKFLEKLKLAVYRRVGGHSYVCDKCRIDSNCVMSHISVMFSGGIDSMMLAYLADQCVPKNQPIDLLNVAFETGSGGSYDVPDRVTGRLALTELATDRVWNFVEVRKCQICR